MSDNTQVVADFVVHSGVDPLHLILELQRRGILPTRHVYGPWEDDDDGGSKTRTIFGDESVRIQRVPLTCAPGERDRFVCNHCLNSRDTESIDPWNEEDEDLGFRSLTDAKAAAEGWIQRREALIVVFPEGC